MNPQRALVDNCIGPGASYEFFLADRLAGAFDQRDQDIQRAAAETQRLPVVEQHPLRDKAERSEGEGFFIHREIALKGFPIHTDGGNFSQRDSNLLTRSAALRVPLIAAKATFTQ